MNISPEATDPGEEPSHLAAAKLDELLQALEKRDHSRARTLLMQNPELAQWEPLLRDLHGLGDQAGLDQAGIGGEIPGVTPVDPVTGAEKMFGRYRLQEELGRGGMGIVYRAFQPDLARSVAVKMILGSRMAGPDEVRRFYSEARLAARVRHPHIVAIFEAGEVDGQHFYAMEHVDGISLDRHVREANGGRPLDVHEACRLMVPVIRAVGHLHREGILHRDLKPANLLMDRSGQLHVADFGLATVLNPDFRQTLSGTILGTPAYMPPEQAAGRIGELTPQSDVYSLGAILYELLAGRPIVQDDSPARMLLQVIEREPSPIRQFNRHVPLALWWVVRRSLEKKSADRYATADAFADDLDRFLRDEPVDARSDAWSREIVRIARRHPPVTYRLMAISAALAVVAARVAWYPDSLEFYAPVMTAIVVWAALVILWERLWQQWPPRREAVSNAMTQSDVVVLTYIMQITSSVDGPVMALYHIVISAAGLSLRPFRIWMAVGASLAAYAFLLMSPPVAGVERHPHLSVLFALSLVVCGAIAGFHARRLSILSPKEDVPPR